MEPKEKVERTMALHQHIESELEEIFGEEHVYTFCVGANSSGRPLVLKNINDIGGAIFLSMCVNHLTDEFTPEQKMKILKVVDGEIYEDFKQ